MQHLNEHATGILNIDPCRTEQGRFPTNVLHDGSTEVLADFEQYGYKRRSNATEKLLMAESAKEGVFSRLRKGGCKTTLYNDAGSVVRYFYCAKPSVAERHNGVVGGNPHHTVKPIALMRWLVRLVTPENGTILDPYAGSGTTCIAAMQGGFKYLGIEINSEYVSIAAQRLKFYEQHFGRGCHGQMGLFA
jgi:site-specific DNA-methyltransferase (adenine-specific)